MKKISKSAAIKKAKRLVGPLYRFGDGWKYNIWPDEQSIGREQGPFIFWLASWKRSQAMLDIARDTLGKPWKEYTGTGRWTDSI